MKFKKSLNCIDMHTAGEAARIVTSGLPSIPGNSMAEKKDYLKEHMDNLRRCIMLEPRGHDDMFGAFLLPPVISEANFGIIFMDTGGYLNMCGHNSIAAATAAVETGMIEVKSTETKVPLVLDTPAGVIRAVVELESPGSSEVSRVSIVNVPSFLYKRDVTITLPKPYGNIQFDIAFGGSFFAIVDTTQLGLTVSIEHLSTLQDIGDLLRTEVNKHVKVQHAQLPHIHSVDCVEFFSPPTHSEASCKNVVIFGHRQVDRSPCGTGTSAKMAVLYARGKLQVGELFVYESIIGTLFHARITAVLEDVGGKGIHGVLPEISGSAFITGFNTLLFDPRDPFCDGFTLKK